MNTGAAQVCRSRSVDRRVPVAQWQSRGADRAAYRGPRSWGCATRPTQLEPRTPELRR